MTQRDLSNPSDFLLAERDILIKFFDIADRRGLLLSDDSQKLRAILETLRSERGEQFVVQGEYDWRTVDLALSLAALAQHYGLPTRLLDWTRQAYTAAFFAAESAAAHIEESDPGSCLVVWAFYFPALGKHDEIYQPTDAIRVVTAPSATNSNLKAQQGVFTLLGRWHTNDGNYPPLDQFLADQYAREMANSEPDDLIVGCKLRKFTLSVSKANELLRLLAKLDITPSAIYPGFRSIVDDIKMQNQW